MSGDLVARLGALEARVADLEANIPKKKRFKPPTLAEIECYIEERGLRVRAKDFLDYFTETDWVKSNGERVLSWKGTLLTWDHHRRGNMGLSWTSGSSGVSVNEFNAAIKERA